jgi:hypothetical protein
MMKNKGKSDTYLCQSMCHAVLKEELSCGKGKIRRVARKGNRGGEYDQSTLYECMKMS